MIPLTPLDWGKIGAAVLLHTIVVEIIKVVLRAIDNHKRIHTSHDEFP